MAVTINDIEDAIIAFLKTAVPALKTVDSYSKILEADDIAKLVAQVPAAYVVFDESRFEILDGPNHKQTINFVVFVVAKNLRGNSAARKDSGGAYELIEEVLLALTNTNLGSIELERLAPVDVRFIEGTKTTIAYAIKFQTNFEVVFDWN